MSPSRWWPPDLTMAPVEAIADGTQSAELDQVAYADIPAADLDAFLSAGLPDSSKEAYLG